jgi:hypothetical protein
MNFFQALDHPMIRTKRIGLASSSTAHLTFPKGFDDTIRIQDPRNNDHVKLNAKARLVTIGS